ncbi:MAG: MerR family transcriptional regulator [Desulfovibrio sp.]|nr:MerR family transcriptional regulator [Desulfovibrio sp.]
MGGKTYRIGEAAELLQLKSYVLRFWETEFPQLDPVRTDKGQRIYSEENLALLRRIKQLLHEQGMTIEGARRILDGSAVQDKDFPEQLVAVPDKHFLNDLQRDLQRVKDLLQGPRRNK